MSIFKRKQKDKSYWAEFEGRQLRVDDLDEALVSMWDTIQRARTLHSPYYLLSGTTVCFHCNDGQLFVRNANAIYPCETIKRMNGDKPHLQPERRATLGGEWA